MDNVEHFYAKDRKSWRRWLELNHNTKTAVWLVYDKGASRTLSWPDIVQEALCFGWIDSRPGKVSDTQSKIYVSKRNPNSVWSKINKEHIEELINKGLMEPAGYSAIDIAKRNGSWNALDLSDALIYPEELKSMFAQDELAENNFENFPVGSRRNTLQWIYDAKTEPTKTNRIKQVYEAVKQNTRLR